MYTAKKPGWYLYGICQHCREPKKESKPGFCRGCFWNPERRFWDKVTKTPNCWNWIGPKHPFGYGITSFRKVNMGAHRASWIMQNGHIPTGMSVLHKCDNPACVRPDHLFLGTQFDNMQDRSKKLRQPYGEKAWHAKLSNNDVLKIRKIYIRNSKEYGQNALAKMFNISQAAIWFILNNRNWKHIPMEV